MHLKEFKLHAVYPVVKEKNKLYNSLATTVRRHFRDSEADQARQSASMSPRWSSCLSSGIITVTKLFGELFSTALAGLAGAAWQAQIQNASLSAAVAVGLLLSEEAVPLLQVAILIQLESLTVKR